MKRIIVLVLMAVTILATAGCMQKESSQRPQKVEYEKPGDSATGTADNLPDTADPGGVDAVPDTTPPPPPEPSGPAQKNAALDTWPANVPAPAQAAAYIEGPAGPPATIWPPAGKPVRCEITKDDIYSKVGHEKYTNCGQTSRWKLKGQQEHTIFDADLSALKGKVITGALLHMKNASPKWPYYRVGVSSVASPWEEGSATGMYKKIEGEACYVQAELGKRDWSFPGSLVMDVVFGRGHTVWKFADATPVDGQGWQTVAVDPQVIAARAADVSYGFFAYDEVGHEWEDSGNKFQYWGNPNRFSHSRESSSNKPWLEVWVDGEDNQAPEAVSQCAVITDGFPAGQALVKWLVPADRGAAGTLGFNVAYTRANGEQADMPRYLIPMAGAVGTECRMHIQDLSFDPGEQLSLAITAVDAAGNAGPVFTREAHLSDTAPVFPLPPTAVESFPRTDNLPEVGGLRVAVVDLLDKINPVNGTMIPKHALGYKGGNHIFSAKEKKIRLFSARNEDVAFQVNFEGPPSQIQLELSFAESPGLQASLSEFGYVKAGNALLPDPLVPTDGKISLPSTAGQLRVPNQKNHSLICEVYVPHEETAGLKQGILKVTVGGAVLKLAVELNVWDFTLPNKLSFLPEMNSYQSASPDLYRLAHRHRTCINPLPYGWSCGVGRQWSWNGNDFDWSRFDEQYGPLFDGSLFEDLPRAGEPVDVAYLAFSESWPVDLIAHFTPSYWADEAFSKEFVDETKRAYAAFAKHCDAKGWHDTMLHFYLNNKVYNRKSTTKNVAPWIFDEPRETSDFWAIRWWGILFHEAVDQVRGQAKLMYRGDVSYSMHGRNMFWGVMDVECLGGANAQKFRMKYDEWRLWSPSYVTNYGSANAIAEPNSQPAAWMLKSWAKGSAGVLPWNTRGNKGSWTKADTLAVFYPADDGPMPSVRLKAFRRGQQDVEYLTLLYTVYNLPRFAVAAGLEQAIDLSSKVHKTSETDAGKIRFSSADPALLWKVRMAVAQLVAAKKPAYKRALHGWDLPDFNMKRLPDIGYTAVAPPVAAHAPKADTFNRR